MMYNGGMQSQTQLSQPVYLAGDQNLTPAKLYKQPRASHDHNEPCDSSDNGHLIATAHVDMMQYQYSITS